MFVKLLPIVTALVVYANAQSQSPCKTLRSEVGICVPILTCSTISQMLERAPKPLPPSVIRIVQDSHCGTFNNAHHVCCDKSRITTPTTPQVTTTAKASSASLGKMRKSGERSNDEVQSGMRMLQAMECGESGGDKIANGQDAMLSEFPWMALLVYDDGVRRTMECGGSLITDRYVLTAAHCIRVSNRKVVSVRLGEHDMKEEIDCIGGRKRICAPPKQEIDVEESIYHEGYRPSQFSNDIGLLRLVTKAVMLKSVQPICLPVTKSSREAEVDRMFIAGWGRIENGLRASVLQKAVVPVKTNDYCQQIHKLISVTDAQICAGGENDVDTCKGDSGGPLFFTARYTVGVKYIQFGVVSAGSSTCGSNFPGIYAKVLSYLPWIAGNIAA